VNQSSDHELWAAVVHAQADLAARRADFHQHASLPGPVLSQALHGSNREKSAALQFLATFGYLSDHMELLPELVEMAQSHRWAGYARHAIGAARSDQIIPALRQLLPAVLQTADYDSYRRLAELLSHIRAWHLLGELCQRALASDDTDIREVGEDFTSSYGPLWQAS
jgi:hypothetical protein